MQDLSLGSQSYKNFIIHEYKEISSTNSYALELLEIGKIFDREIILAQSQTGGRGRQNRTWISPQGNLYFSLVLKNEMPTAQLSQLSFVAIVALRKAVQQLLCDVKIQVKWPNDLLIADKKVAGLLLEGKPRHVVIGIGVNLNSYPEDTIFPATDLKTNRLIITPFELLKKFLDEFETTYRNWLDFGFAGIRNLWLKNVYRLKEQVTVTVNEKKLTGIFEGLDEDGNMMLNCEEVVIKISSGDVR